MSAHWSIVIRQAKQFSKLAVNLSHARRGPGTPNGGSAGAWKATLLMGAVFFCMDFFIKKPAD